MASLSLSPEVVMTKHAKYYFDDGDLFILVDSTLCRVHSHFIRKHMPSLLDDIPERYLNGSSAIRPIIVDKVSVDAFGQLLWVMYDETFERNAPSDEWLSIVLAAEELQAQNIVKFALKKLSALPTPTNADPITLITLDDRHFIRQDWAKEAYLSLCKREEPLTEYEASQLGFRLVAVIARTREAVLRPTVNTDGEAEPADQIIARVIASHGKAREEIQEVVPPLDDTRPYDCDVVGGNLADEAGGLSFKIHRHFLVHHSPVICKMLEADDCPRQDQEDAAVKPLRLDDISAHHFSWLLWVFYDENFASVASRERWLAIRGLARQYSMNHLGAFATKQLGNDLDLIERVLSIDTFSMTGTWAVETCKALYTREAPLSVEKGEKLGLRRCVEVSMERERKLRVQLGLRRNKSKGSRTVTHII